MKLFFVMIRRRRLASSTLEAGLIARYIKRIASYASCAWLDVTSEEKFFSRSISIAGRTRPFIVLFDGRGDLLSSDAFAKMVAKTMDLGSQTMIFAIGPADGWSPEALKQADAVVAFGKITLPHELAAVVASEQIYRALTILANHPYHSDH